MAAAPTYNKPVTCLCDNPAEYHCNTCGDTLCSNCKTIHEKSKGTHGHSVVPYGEKLRPEHLSSLSCPDHKGKDCTFWCEKCGKATCMDCVTSTHSAHKMIKLETVLIEKTSMLQKELADLESNELRRWKDLEAEAKQVRADYIQKVNGVDKQLDKQAKEFHAKVDKIFKAGKQQLQDIKNTNLVVLVIQEETVSDRVEKVKQEIKECEDKLRNGSVETLLQYKEEHEGKKPTLPKILSAKPPIFTPRQINSLSLAEMFGKLTNTAGEQKHENKTEPQNIPKFAKKGKTSPLQGATRKQDESDRNSEKSIHPGNQNISQQVMIPTLLPRQLVLTPSVKSRFSTMFVSGNQSIAYVGSGLAWMKTKFNRLQLMDQRGSVKDAFITEFDSNHVVVSPQGELLLSDYTNSCIRSISPDKVVKTLFTTPWTPMGLCCLHNGDIAVTFHDEGRVVIYSRSGTIVQELEKKLFKKPYRVAQNKVNNDLYISDQGSNKVVALDASYHVRYEYKGTSLWDMCTDSAGRILITDYKDRVHILDKDSGFLQYLLTWEDDWANNPVGIDVDSEGNAWVVEYRGQVKVVKYLQ